MSSLAFDRQFHYKTDRDGCEKSPFLVTEQVVFVSAYSLLPLDNCLLI